MTARPLMLFTCRPLRWIPCSAQYGSETGRPICTEQRAGQQCIKTLPGQLCSDDTISGRVFLFAPWGASGSRGLSKQINSVVLVLTMEEHETLTVFVTSTRLPGRVRRLHRCTLCLMT